MLKSKEELKYKVYNLYIRKDIIKQLKAVAEYEDKSPSKLVQQIFLDYVERSG